jgi:molybdopterin/thiamine biosynthesis adenylyltransferase
MVYTGASHIHERTPLILIDGDDFEGRNRERQDFRASGNKAQVKVEEMRQVFPELSIRAVPEFITEKNVSFYVRDNDLVFLAVDNHPTRRLISRRCQDLTSVVLVSGGNEWTEGNVQVYIRWEGKDITSPLTMFHPEIERAEDTPGAASGNESAEKKDPQLLFTDLAVASHMLNVFYAVISGELRFEEVRFDIVLGITAPITHYDRSS